MKRKIFMFSILIVIIILSIPVIIFFSFSRKVSMVHYFGSKPGEILLPPGTYQIKYDGLGISRFRTFKSREYIENFYKDYFDSLINVVNDEGKTGYYNNEEGYVITVFEIFENDKRNTISFEYERYTEKWSIIE